MPPLEDPRSWTDPLPEALANWLGQGHTQSQLADRLSLTQPAVSRILNGKRQVSVANRLQMARALRLPLAAVGLNESDDDDVGAGLLLWGPRLVGAAEAARYAGRSSEFVEVLNDLDDEITGVRTIRVSDDDIARLYVDIKLARALILGDVFARRELWQITVLTMQGLDAARAIEDRRRIWKASGRHGNGLRRTGNVDHGVKYLEASVEQAHSAQERNITRIPLARAQAELHNRSKFEEVLAELKTALEDPDGWTPGFQPLSVAEIEARGRMSLGMDLPTVDIFDDADRSTWEGTPPAAQWFAISSLTKGQLLFKQGDVAAGFDEIDKGVRIARGQHLSQQLERALSIITPFVSLDTRGSEIQAELLREIETEIQLRRTQTLPGLRPEQN